MNTHKLFWVALPLIFAVAVALILIKETFPNGDTFFIIKTGQYIVDNGFVPTTNPFVIHDEFGIIVQQWLFDVLISQIYAFGGNFGLYLYSVVILFVSLFMMYKFFGFYSKNTQMKLLLLAFWGLMATYFVVARPTSLSFLLCMSTVMVMESYRRNGRWPILLLLPVLSLITINIHASMWPLTFVLMVPYIFPDKLPHVKELGFGKGLWAFVKEWFSKWKGVLLAMVGMFLAGFLNPNGLRGMAYLLLSYNEANSANVIAELAVPEITSLPGLITLATILLLFKYIGKHKGKLDFANIYMAAGTIVLAMMHNRNVWFLFFGMSPLFLIVLNEFKWKVAKKEYKSAVAYGTLNACYVCFILLLGIFSFTCGSLEVTDTNQAPVKAATYLDTLDKDEVVLFTEFNNGAYMEFRGYEVYMDARPELFQEKVNGKADVYSEYLYVRFGLLDFQEFFDKYQFTHLIVEDGTPLSGFLRAYDNAQPVVKGNGYILYEMIPQKSLASVAN